MSIRTLKQIKKLSGKRVLVRVGFDVPVKKGKVTEDVRLLAAVPTVQYLLQQQAKVILLAHQGRPAGKVVRSLSLEPVAKRFGEMLGLDIKVLKTGNWKLSEKKWVELVALTHELESGSVVMCDNMRFSPYEQKDTTLFARALATLGDIFVLDGFAVAHRADASVAGVAKHLPAYAGLLLEKEIEGLTRVTKDVKKPYVAVIGGAKMETKIPVMKQLLPKVTHLLVGGGIVNTYLKAKKYGVGTSLVDADFQKEALLYGGKRKVILPVDVVVGSKDGKHHRLVQIQKKPHEICKPGEAIFDIGPATIRLYASYIKKAKTLLWNGAMGYFEQKPYHIGTLSVARLVASRSKGKAFGAIGGGETLQAMDMIKMGEYVDLVSTGGGAMLEFLSGKKLPGIQAVTKK